MSERELLPCPFCGCKDTLQERNEHGWPVVRCSVCGACGPCTNHKPENAVTAWNRRQQITPQAGEEAAVDKYVDDYVFEHDEGYYTPTTAERTLIKDAIMGFLPLLDDAAADRTALTALADQGAGEAEPVAFLLKRDVGAGDYTSVWYNEIKDLQRKYGGKIFPLYRTAPPPPVCPHIRSSDEGTQWCDLAARVGDLSPGAGTEQVELRTADLPKWKPKDIPT